MLAAAAVFVFAFTPDPAGDYNAALDELAALREVSASFERYGYYLRDHLKPTQEADAKFVLNLAHGAGAKVPSHVPIQLAFASDFSPSGQGLVRNYYDFFVGTQSFAPIDFERDPGLGEQLKTQVAINHPQAGGLELESVRLDGTIQLSDGTRILDWQRRDSIPQLNLQFTFHDSISKTVRIFGVGVPVVYSLGKAQNGHFASDWLRVDPVGQHLIDAGSGAVFPHLRNLSLWNRISLMSPDAADTFIQARLDSMKNDTMSFFGISVDKGLALWMGPTVCLSVLLFLLLHLRHFAALEGAEKVGGYPWIAFFPDSMSGALTVLSVLVLPAVANSILLYKHGSFSAWPTRAGAVISLLLAAFGLWACIEIRRLRKRVAVWLSSADRDDSDWTLWGSR